VLKVLGWAAAAGQEVYQPRPRVWRARAEPEGLAGQAVDRNKCTLHAQETANLYEKRETWYPLSGRDSC
jgi:hypothetical protein